MDKQKEYLNEEKYQKANNKVKWGGRIAIVIGILLIFIGAFVVKVPDMGQDGWFEAETTRNLLIFPGVFITLVGCMIRFIVANQRNITAYMFQQQMPVAGEAMEKMAPVVGKAGAKIAKEMAPAYGEVAKEISKGIKEGLKDEDNK